LFIKRVLVFMCLLFVAVFVLVGKDAEAGVTSGVKYNLGLYTVTTTDQYPPGYNAFYGYQVIDLQLPANNTAVTNIKLTVSGSAGPSSLYKIYLCDGATGIPHAMSLLTNGSSETVLDSQNNGSYPYRFTFPSSKTISLDPCSGQGNGNRKLVVYVYSGSYITLNVNVNEVDYNTYTYDNAWVNLAADNTVEFHATRGETIPYTHLRFYNAGTGQLLHESVNAYNKDFYCRDFQVVAEKKYYYNLAVTIGNRMDDARWYGWYGIRTNSDATNAYNAALQAKVSADNASTQSWYTGTYGGSSESVGNIAGYIRNTQLPGISTKIDNLTTTVNNLSGADTSAPVVNVQTLSGALATSGSSIQAAVTVSDSNDSSFTYSINGGTYSALPSNRIISLPVSSPGPNAITVSVKDPAGNVGSATIIIRKL